MRQYDMVENLVSETHNTVTGGALTQWTTATTAYDGLHRPIYRIDRDGASNSFAFDAANDLTSRTMPEGWSGGRPTTQRCRRFMIATLAPAEPSPAATVTPTTV